MKLIVFSLLIFCFLPVDIYAQFYTAGDDPAGIRWYRTDTRNFSIIYPEGLDSLAFSYGYNLEKYRNDVSYSAGYLPGEMTDVRMPVVLHAYNARSNGSVAWAPKRMDLFTIPQAYKPEAMPWIQMLSIHESRHVAQMQFGLSYVFRPFRYILGEMFAGAMAGVYPNGWTLEGDAVVAETALSSSGRGRSADFLNYYMIAFDHGDFRNYYRWKRGSYRYYTPDEYALGYMIISGIRYNSGTPHYTDVFLKHAARRPYDFLIDRSVSRKVTGKNLNEAFHDAMMLHYRIWKDERDARAPFIPSSEVSDRKNRRYTVYSGNEISGSCIYSVRSGLSEAPSLVKIDPSGHERKLSAFASTVSDLRYSDDDRRLYWSETVPDIRWTLKKSSVIRYLDTVTGRKKTLSRDGNLFNPSVAGNRLLCTSYNVGGWTSVCIIDKVSGETLNEFRAPGSLQVTETAYLDGRIYAAAVSEAGFGIYLIEPEGYPAGHEGIGIYEGCHGYSWKTVLEPEHVQMTDFRSGTDALYFTSDRTGSSELYRFIPGTSVLYRLTSTEYGAQDFVFGKDSSLYYSASLHEGRLLRKTSSGSILSIREEYNDIHRYRIADRMSEQERELKAAAGDESEDSLEVTFSGPVRYRKFPAMFNIHSWAPVYFKYDNISELSQDNYYQTASLGATALLQNRLGTFSGYFGYSAHLDPYDRSYWRHSAHVNFTYTGLYPVIEASLDFNDRAARNYYLSVSDSGKDGAFMATMKSYATTLPYLSGKIRAYVPMDFSSGGWSRGVIPQVSWSISNDVYSGKIRQNLGISARGYIIRSMASSEIYPDWGIGLETGMIGYPGLASYYSPLYYGYIYGYTPGFTSEQGLRVSGTVQWQTKGNSIFSTSAANTVPRGLQSNGYLYQYLSQFRASGKITADYAIPVWVGDFSLGSAFYGSRALFTPHFDCSIFPGGSLFSAGLTAELEFACFFWIGTPIKIGVTYSYNGGPSFRTLNSHGFNMGHHYVGPVFSLTLPQ